MTKSGREIMEIFEAFDLTGTAWSAAQLTGCDAKTVARYVAVRDAGGDPLAKTARPRLIDGFMDKVEELVDRSQGEDPGGRGAPQARRDGLPGVGAVDPAGGRGGEGGLAGGQAKALPALDTRAGDVAAVGLGRRAADQRPEDAAVRGVAGLVPVPGGDPGLGPAARHADLVHRPGAARRRRGADLPADRQRAHRHHGPRRGDPGAAPGDGRARPALRLQGGDVRAVRPGVQGRGRGDGEDRQGRPGALGGEPAAGLRQLRGAGGSLPRVLRPGQRPGAPGDRGRPGRAAGGRAGAAAPAAGRALRAGAGRGAAGRRRPDGPVRVGALLHPARPRRDQGVVPGRRGGAGDHRPHRPRRGRDRPAPPVDPGQPADPATSTTRTIPAGTGRASPGRGRGRRPRRRSWPSATARSGGSPRPPPPARPGSGRRWPARSSWPPWSARTGWTRRSGWRRSPAGSPTATWPRSSTTWPPSGRPSGSCIADEAHSVQPGTSGWARLGTQEAGR